MNGWFTAANRGSMVESHLDPQNSTKSNENMIDNKEKEGFISSDKFMGEMKGYVFKNDESGLGYYIDG